MITFGLSGRRSKPYGYRSRPPAVPPHVSHVLPRYPLAATPVSHSPLTRNTRPLCALSLDSRTTREAVGNNYSKAECKRWARARRYERISACWICRCSARVRCTPQFQHSWSVVPTRVPKHRAQCASDGRRARRLADVRAEPLPASLRRHSCAAGRDEQTSCQSRRAAARPAARKQLLLPPRCRRASTSSNASARARPPGSSRAQTSRLACQPLLAARRGAFSNMKSFLAGPWNFQTVCFISL